MQRYGMVVLLVVVWLLSGCNADDEPLPTIFVLPSLSPSPQSLAAAVTDDPTTVTAAPVTPSGEVTGLLEFWEPANGSIQAGEIDQWRFIGQAGDNVTVGAVGVEAVLTLQTESGEVLQSGERLQAVLPASGTYTVQIQLIEETDGGDYQIGVGYADRSNPNEVLPTPVPEVVGVPTPLPVYADLGTYITRLTHNNTIGGTMDEGDPSHIYTFDGIAEQYVQIEMNRVSGQINPRLTLYNPKGQPIATDGNSAGNDNAILRNIRLEEDGLYSVQADGAELSGGYSIRLLQYNFFAAVTPTVVIPPTETPIPTYSIPTAAAHVPGNRLEDHRPVLFVLNPGDVGIHSFFAAAGETVTVGVSPAEGSALLPQMEIVNPDGLIVGSAQSVNGEAVVPNLVADLEGAYQVFVRGESNTAGQYLVAYGRGSTRFDVLQGEAPFGERNESTVAQRGARDVWTLELRAGDTITAAVNPLPGSLFDPYLELVAAETPDQIIVSDDNGGGGLSAFIRTVTINETGLYLLRISSPQGASTGGYALIWRYVDAAPTRTPPPAVVPILVLDDDVPDSQYRFYPFYGRTGQRIQVNVTGLDGFDPVAALVSPTGDVLTEVDDSENGGLNPFFTYVLPADGTYLLRVNGYIQGGAFDVVVEELFPLRQP